MRNRLPYFFLPRHILTIVNINFSDMERFYELSEITLLPKAANHGFQSIEKYDFYVEDLEDHTGISRTLPIFTAPRESIIGKDNAKLFQDKGIRPVLPASEDINVRLEYCQWIFCSFTLGEIRKHFCERKAIYDDRTQLHVNIETDNGHSEGLLAICKNLRRLYGAQIIIMAGNIGRDTTYKEYCNSGIDYIRVGIGTSSLEEGDNSGFYFPLGSLLDAIKNYKRVNSAILPRQTKLVVDGGLESITDVIKAFALGADYVMIGFMFAGLLEAAGPLRKSDKNKDGSTNFNVVDPNSLAGMTGPQLRSNGLCRQYYGNNEFNFRKFSPKWIGVKKTLDEWIQEFIEKSYYAFTMSDVSNWADFGRSTTYGISLGGR